MLYNVLRCAVLCCAVLCCAALRCALLHCAGVLLIKAFLWKILFCVEPDSVSLSLVGSASQFDPIPQIRSLLKL